MEKEIEKEELTAFLKEPEIYPHKPVSVRLIQTHISYVAIAPPYVYKVKKPVDLGFLDFTTLEKRLFFCRKEVELNRRLCKDVYDDVVAISSSDGALAIEDSSRIVEYAVKMKQLEADGFLHNRLQQDKVKRQDLQRLAKHLQAFYLDQQSTPDIAENALIGNIKAPIEENFAQTERFIGDLIAGHAFGAIADYNEQFFCRYSSLLNKRRTSGKILDCHGDLRLEHVHIDSDDVRVFDCIEFNDRFRYIDVANEIAFLAMDLDFHGRRDLAGYFVRQMSERLDDPVILKLLDFYKCYRAYVRAKVKSLKSVEPEVPENEKERSRNDAIRLYRLSLEYAISGSQPMVIIIMGRIGTGKSTVAERLSQSLGWQVLRSDLIRKQLAGVPPTSRPDESGRKKLYSSEMTEKTYKELMQGAIENARHGKSSLIDATYAGAKRRGKLRNSLESERIRFCFVELTASDDVVKKRLLERERSSNSISDARLEDFNHLSAGYHSPDALEMADHIVVDTDESLESILSAILKGIMRLKPLRI
jgi:hypothetical protein